MSRVGTGRLLAGKYFLLESIGVGGMGEVFRADHRTLHQAIAIKILRTTPASSSSASARFAREAQLAASLSRRSRFIASVNDYGVEDGVAFIAMELLEGESLEARIDRGALPLPEVVRIIDDIGRGLAIAHAERVIHRDLKPANLFLTLDEDKSPIAKILDFGIAKQITKARGGFKLTRDGVILGSPSYMSPEQARGGEPGPEGDLWALAVVAFEALTGLAPFDGATAEDTLVRICMGERKAVTELAPSLPRSLDRFFERAFAKDVALRFPTATALREAFASAAAEARPTLIADRTPAGQSIEIVAPPRDDSRPMSVPRRLYVGAGAIGVACACALALALFQGAPSHPITTVAVAAKADLAPTTEPRDVGTSAVDPAPLAQHVDAPPPPVVASASTVVQPTRVALSASPSAIAVPVPVPVGSASPSAGLDEHLATTTFPADPPPPKPAHDRGAVF